MRRFCNKYINLLRWGAVQRTDHVRVACFLAVAAGAGWLVAFGWAGAVGRRLAEQRVRSGLVLDLGPESCRVRQDPASAARLARDGERVLGGEARERQRVPACR